MEYPRRRAYRPRSPPASGLQKLACSHWPIACAQCNYPTCRPAHRHASPLQPMCRTCSLSDGRSPPAHWQRHLLQPTIEAAPIHIAHNVQTNESPWSRLYAPADAGVSCIQWSAGYRTGWSPCDDSAEAVVTDSEHSVDDRCPNTKASRPAARGEVHRKSARLPTLIAASVVARPTISEQFTACTGSIPRSLN